MAPPVLAFRIRQALEGTSMGPSRECRAPRLPTRARRALLLAACLRSCSLLWKQLASALRSSFQESLPLFRQATAVGRRRNPRLGIRVGQAEFGPVEQQRGRLQGAEQCGFAVLALMLAALASTMPRGRKHAPLFAAPLVGCLDSGEVWPFRA